MNLDLEPIPLENCFILILCKIWVGVVINDYYAPFITELDDNHVGPRPFPLTKG